MANIKHKNLIRWGDKLCYLACSWWPPKKSISLFFFLFLFHFPLTLVTLPWWARWCEYKSLTGLRCYCIVCKGFSLTREQQFHNASCLSGQNVARGQGRKQADSGELTSSFSRPLAGAAGIILPSKHILQYKKRLWKWLLLHLRVFFVEFLLILTCTF